MKLQRIAEWTYRANPDDLEEIGQWVDKHLAKFQKAAEQRHTVSYYPCCHTFCTSNSPARLGHDQSTKLTYKAIMKSALMEGR